MAEASGVTEASLKTKITELLQATHVEIEDMSGPPHYPSSHPLAHIYIVLRWLWTSLFRSDSLAPIREEDYTGKTSLG
jgi:hypothetical protein